MNCLHKVLRVGALAGALISGGSLANAAPVVWAGNGHEYDVITAEDITWTAAQAATALMGSGWHLATITSAAENGFVAGLLPAAAPQRSHYWLGGSDATVEGTWTWVTGEAFSFTGWWGGEPNNSGNEDYLAMDLRGGVYAWNDAPADMLAAGYDMARGYIIERSSAVPEPGTLSLAGLAALALAALTRRRRRA